ncbi:MAG: type II toxin-antitoxin system ParD family antitoxin [Thermoproteus sp.]|nr:type II toxin-antitoxin system ParD family antitoxin [Thermoproteus sp.]
MPMISLHLPRKMLEQIDELVRRGIYPNRSEVIRAAVRDLLYKEAVVAAQMKVEEEENDISLLRGR